jgi:NAD(P)H-flavin reductase
MVSIDAENSIVMMCGPEIMMRMGARHLEARGIRQSDIYLSIERNMQCGVGLCGHCQIGPWFTCKDGPVMRYDKVADFLGGY